MLNEQASEKAIEAAAAKIKRFGWPYRDNAFGVAQVMAATIHDAALGDARSMNEAWARTYYVKEVIKWLWALGGPGEWEAYAPEFARRLEAALERGEFGGER